MADDASARDRDRAGRPKNARPRDVLGRPLRRGAENAITEEELPDDPERLLEIGIEHFNARRFFQAHETWETAWHVLKDFAIPRVVGKELSAAADFGSLVRGIRGHNMAKAGVETALWDLEARIKYVPLWKLLGGTRERIDCGVSIGIQPAIDKLLAA